LSNLDNVPFETLNPLQSQAIHALALFQQIKSFSIAAINV
jgi:hypothetical protein